MSGGKDGAWRFGGLYSERESIYGRDIVRIPNTDLDLIQVDGENRISLTLPIPADGYISSGDVVEHEAGTFLFANECAPLEPVGEVFSCGGERGAVYEIREDRTGVERLSQDSGLAPGRFRFVGHDAEYAWATVATGLGEAQFTSEVSLFRFSFRDRTWEAVDLPDGVVTLGSVCASRSNVYSVVPTFSPDMAVTGLDLYRLRDMDQLWELTDATQFEPMSVMGGAMACSDSTTVVMMGDGASTGLITRPESGSFAKPLMLDEGQVFSIATDGRSIVLGVAAGGSDQYQLITITETDLDRVEFPATSPLVDGGRPEPVFVGGSPYEASAATRSDVPLRPMSSGRPI